MFFTLNSAGKPVTSDFLIPPDPSFIHYIQSKIYHSKDYTMKQKHSDFIYKSYKEIFFNRSYTQE